MLKILPRQSHSIHPLNSLNYRPDIDGLRAIAVFLVVGFHAFPEWFPSGFIGVSIFFVISGFLISSIIFRSLAQGRFSFTDFYSRRVKRIFPALALVMFSCLLAGWFVLGPHEYMQLGKHAAAGTVFIVNFVLRSEAGYFDNAGVTKPFLHLWSLSIEEQFYLLFPFFCFIAWRVGRNFLLRSILACTLLSFILNIFYIRNEPVSAFFWPHSRIWELLLGVLLAYFFRSAATGTNDEAVLQDPCRDGSMASMPDVWGRRFYSSAGFIFILVALYFIDKQTAFPGWWALLPTVGTVLIIAGGPRSRLNQVVLSNRAMIWLGLISYPLYLWHYPLLSFANILFGSTPPLAVRVSLVALAVLLAWLTYVLVERRVRFGTGKKEVAVALVVLVGLLGFSAYCIQLWEGIPGRTSVWLTVKNEGNVGNVDFYDTLNSKYFQCEPLEIRNDSPSRNSIRRCFQSKSGVPVDIAIFGDSHAEHLFPGLADALPQMNVACYVQGRGPPFRDVGEIDRLIAFIISQPSIKSVIISSNWHSRLRRLSAETNLYKELFYLVTRFDTAGKKIYIAEDFPTFTFDPETCKFDRLWPFVENRCVDSKSVLESQRVEYATYISEIARDYPNVSLIPTHEYISDDQFCRMSRDGQLLFRDRNHLNVNGSRYVADRILFDFPELSDAEGANYTGE